MKRKIKMQDSSVPVGIAWGLLASVVMLLLCCAVTAALVASEAIREGSVAYGALLTLLLSAGAGALTAGLRVKGKYLPVCLGTGGAFYVFLLCCTGLFFDGSYTGMLPAGLAVLGGCGVVALLMARSSMQGGKRKRKYRLR